MRTAAAAAVAVVLAATACSSEPAPPDARLTTPGGFDRVACDPVTPGGTTDFAGVYDLIWHCGNVDGGGMCDPSTMGVDLVETMTIVATSNPRQYRIVLGPLEGTANLDVTGDGSPAMEDLIIAFTDMGQVFTWACTGGPLKVQFIDPVESPAEGPAWTAWVAAATRR